MIVVTGRMVRSVQRALEPAGLDDPLICYQGAVVVDGDGTWLRHTPIPLELARDAIAFAADEGYSPNVYVGDQLFVAEVTKHARDYAEFQHLEIQPVGDLLGWLAEPPTKLVLVGDPDGARRGREPRQGAVRRQPLHLEVAAVLPRVCSGRRDEGNRARLPRLAHGLHAASETIAFGDGENDVELVEWAGYGIAVENAHERVKAVADWICPSAEVEGVAAGARSVSRLEAMIDLRAARNDPAAFRAALARRGAGEAFDELLAADEHWRALVPRVDELRAQQKLDGKPSPEQLEQLRRTKDELRQPRTSSARPRRPATPRSAKVPNLPHASAADGFRDEDAIVVKEWGNGARPSRSSSTSRSATTTWSAARRSRAPASASSSATRPGSRWRSTASRSTV